MERALITGGTGFVGKHLSRLLRASGIQTAVLTANESESHGSARDYFGIDVRDADAVRQVMSEFKPNSIYHLAAISSVEWAWKFPRITYQVNVFGTLNVLEAATRLPAPPRILNVSTAQVYAPGEYTLTEDSPVKPSNPYAISKAMAELAVLQFQSAGVEVITARGFNHAGPGQSSDFVVSSIARQFAEMEAGLREPKLVLGNIHVKRDFTDVRDVVKAYVLLMKYGRPGEAYNVCSGKSRSIKEIIAECERLSGTKAELVTHPGKMRPMEIEDLCGDPARLHATTGWTPEVTFATTVLDVLDYWRENLRNEKDSASSSRAAELSTTPAVRNT